MMEFGEFSFAYWNSAITICRKKERKENQFTNLVNKIAANIYSISSCRSQFDRTKKIENQHQPERKIDSPSVFVLTNSEYKQLRQKDGYNYSVSIRNPVISNKEKESRREKLVFVLIFFPFYLLSRYSFSSFSAVLFDPSSRYGTLELSQLMHLYTHTRRKTRRRSVWESLLTWGSCGIHVNILITQWYVMCSYVEINENRIFTEFVDANLWFVRKKFLGEITSNIHIDLLGFM